MDFFDVKSHVGLPLPAAQHQVVHLLGTGPGALQHPALGYTLYHLRGKKKMEHQKRWSEADNLKLRRTRRSYVAKDAGVGK